MNLTYLVLILLIIESYSQNFNLRQLQTDWEGGGGNAQSL